MTARNYDSNGWMEVKDNPISKVGVFPYRGDMIDPSGEMGLDPNAVYQVYRSAEELSRPETIDSFKLIPWVDDHQMLGENFDPAEEKGIEGVTGEDVYFDDGYLRANLKVFSDSHADRVDDGKKELSCGFRCKYELRDGVFGDQKYTVVQKDILGNHLASVDEGRMGPEVSVLDNMTFAVDSKDFRIMPKATKKTLANYAVDGVEPEEFAPVLQLIASKLCAMDADDDEKAEDEDDDKKAEDMGSHADDEKAEDTDDDEKAEDEDDDEKAEDEDDDKAEDEGKYDDKKMGAMDAQIQGLEKSLRKQSRTGMKSVMREIRKRDALYKKVSPTIGAFDYDDMTAGEMAKYACDQLDIKAPKGHESTAIDAFFHNRAAQPVFAADSAMRGGSAKASGKVDEYFAN